MAKIKTAFFCNNCGLESTKWLGKCPSCQQWNTFSEEVIEKPAPTSGNWATGGSSAVSLHEVEAEEQARMTMPDDELNRVLGGGLVKGSLVLLAGEPGIGKSTLFLQTALRLNEHTVLYISGEESLRQIKLRAERLQQQLSTNLLLLAETGMQKIFAELRRIKPHLVIVDSIQTLESHLIESPAGSVSQIRQCAAELLHFAKQTHTPVILIGHITKDGSIAGPKLLEHMVDTVLQFEGDRHYAYRILRTQKNRFGASSELGIYEMIDSGMRPVANPSELWLGQKDESLSGSTIAATIEGIRPLLIEVQALVTPSVYGTPQRTTTGLDTRRLQLLLAVLDKRGGFQFGARDVFVNVAGGFRLEDPSADLALVLALLSSYEDVPVNHRYCFAGEVGLNGEVRSVNKLEQRIAEAARLGFEKMFVSRQQARSAGRNTAIEIVTVGRVDEVYRMIF